MIARRDIVIPSIPALVDIEDVISSGGRLLPENKVAKIIEMINLIDAGSNSRYSKDQINHMLKQRGIDDTVRFSIAKINDQYFAIYKGRKHGKLLGEGAFGSVKFVQNIQDGQWAVIKIIVKNEDGSSNKHAIIRELTSLATIHHLLGHIHRFSTKNREQDEILMVLAPGTTVKNILQHRKMAAVKWLDLSIGVAQAIQSIHAEGLYHRDIKPANMMYDPATGVVTLIDFGLAQTYDPLTRLLTCSRGGTPKYSAPEISKNNAKDSVFTYSEKTEVYALGITLLDIFELKLNGYHIEATYDFLAKIMNPTLRRSILDLLAAMINENPTKRPDMQSVLNTLMHLRENELDIVSKINSIAYLDINDFLNATDTQRTAAISSLKSADEVQLCGALTLEIENMCMRIKHQLESNGIVVAPTILPLELEQDFASIAQTLKEHANAKAQSRHIIFNSFYIQPSRQVPGSECMQIQRSLNRVDISEHHKTIAVLNAKRQMERIQAKHPLDPRLEILAKFIHDIDNDVIKTYQQLFIESANLEKTLQNTPKQSKIGSFAKRHGLYQSTAASRIKKTTEEISRDAHGIQTSAILTKK